MGNSELTELRIEVSANDSTEEDIDKMTRQLLSELRGLDIESAELAKAGPAPKGSKGDPVTIGSIVISSLPTILPAIVALVQAWAARREGRTVKFRGKVGGQLIDFEGSPGDLEKLLATLEKGRKK